MIVQAMDIHKKYKKKVVLDSVNCCIEGGKTYGILGENGAGKSTLIKIMLGLVFQTSGDITIFGKPPFTGNKSIGYLPENICIFPHLSAYDNIDVVIRMTGCKADKSTINNILEKVSLGDTGKKPASRFSLGMKRRLQLAMALLTKKSEFLILDEPTNGLDINGMKWFKEIISSMRKSSVTILIASHSTKELEDIITDYLILHKGVIKKHGVWDNRISKKTKEVHIQVKTEDIEKCTKLFFDMKFEIRENTIFVKTDQSYQRIIKYLTERNIFPENFKLIEESLSDIYMDVIKG